MKIRQQNRFLATGLTLALLVELTSRMALAAPDKPAFLSELSAMEKDVGALAQIWLKSLPEAAASGPHPGKARMLRLTLKGAIDQRGSPQLTIVNVSGLWMEGECWAPEWNQAVHLIEKNTLRFSLNEASGKNILEGDVHLKLMPDGAVPLDDKPIVACFRVKAICTGDRLEGTYQTFAPVVESRAAGQLAVQPASGQAIGTFVELGANEQLPTGRPRRQERTLDIYKIYNLCARQEALASRFYAELRAMAIAGRAKIDFWEARKETVLVDPARRAFDPPEVVEEKKKEKSRVSLDDMLESQDSFDNRGGKSEKSQPMDPSAGDALARVMSMRQRVAIMLSHADQYTRTGGDKTDWLTDTLKTDDPEFGPWYGQDRLDVANGANQLPAGTGGEGPQRWPSVPEWKVIGPFPLTRWDIVTPGLPEVVLDPTIEFKVETSRMKRGKSCRVSTVGWEKSHVGRLDLQWPGDVSSANRVYENCPPILGGYLPCSGIEHSTWYFRSTVESSEDQTLWTGIGVNDRARLWVNDKLIWQGPMQYEDYYSEYVALVKIPFKKGRNELFMRLDVNYSSPYMWMRVCTQGSPRSHAAVKAKQEAVAAARKTIKRSEFVSWRGDGTGHYPDANPPVAWNQKTRQNVKWFTPLPYWSSSTAVPAPGTDCVFVTMDPHWLICISKTDGRILWQKAVTLLDLLPEPLRKEGWALYETWWQAKQVVNAIPFHETRDWEKKWQEYSGYWAEGTGIWAPGETRDPHEGTSPELLALLDKKKELEANEDPRSVQEELTKVGKEVEKLIAAASKNDPNSASAKCARSQKTFRDFVDFLHKYSNISGPIGYWWDYTGYVFATPISDGKHVWVKNGMDVAACFDLDGNLKWMKRIWGSAGTDRSMSSPLLVDGKLIMQLVAQKPFPLPGDASYKETSKRSPVKEGGMFLALDAATGEQCWKTEGVRIADWNCSTPAVVTLTQGQETMKVIVSAAGFVIRADDGKVLVPEIGIYSGFASPAPIGDLVVMATPHISPVRLIMQDRDTVGYKRLWTVAYGFGALSYGGSTVADNLIYGAFGGGDTVKKGVGEVWNGIRTYELETGKMLAHIPTMRKGGNHYSLGAVSAKHMYDIDGDKIFVSIDRYPPMTCAVLTHESNPLLLAVNPIDRTYGACAMEGDRLYLRTYMGVLCVGPTGDEGRRYETRTVAQILLDDVYPDTPSHSDVQTPIVPHGSDIAFHRRGFPRDRAQLASGQAPDIWCALGPFPIEKADAVLKSIGGPTATQNGGGKIDAGGIKGEWVPFSLREFKTKTHKIWEQDGNNFTDLHRNRRVVNFGRVLGDDHLNTVTYLVTTLKWDEPCVMRFEQTMPGVRAWVGGTPIQHGNRVKFGTDPCQLLLEIKVASVPKDGLFLSPRFWLSDDVKKEREFRRAAIERRRPYYEAVVRTAPDSPEAALARHVLDNL